MPESTGSSENERIEASGSSLPLQSGGRRLVSILITTMLVPLLSLCVLELIFILFVEVTDAPHAFWDPVVGLRRTPNQTGRYIRENNINARYHFNTQGWNHLEDYVITKPPETRRVCLVGDSMVEALQVNPEQSMSALCTKLMSRKERPVEWYSFGQSGFGTVQEYLLIRHYVLDYQPDVVVLLFVAVNDLTDTSVYLSSPNPYRSRMVFGDDGQLVLIPASPWQRSCLSRLASKSALYRYFRIQKGLFASPRPPFHERARTFLRQIAESDDSLSASKSHMSAEERQQESWKLIEAVLERAKTECADRGAVFALAYYGARPEIHAALENVVYSPPPKAVDPYCIAERLDEMGRDFLEPITKRLHIPYLDLTPAMIEGIRATGKRHDFSNDVHYSPAGHEFAAKAFAHWIDQLFNSIDLGTTRKNKNVS